MGSEHSAFEKYRAKGCETASKLIYKYRKVRYKNQLEIDVDRLISPLKYFNSAVLNLKFLNFVFSGSIK